MEGKYVFIDLTVSGEERFKSLVLDLIEEWGPPPFLVGRCEDYIPGVAIWIVLEESHNLGNLRMALMVRWEYIASISFFPDLEGKPMKEEVKRWAGFIRER